MLLWGTSGKELPNWFFISTEIQIQFPEITNTVLWTEATTTIQLGELFNFGDKNNSINKKNKK